MAQENTPSFHPKLSSFAAFLLDRQLDDFTIQSINLYKQINLPLLKAFEEYSEQQFYEFVKKNISEFLTSIIKGNVSRYMRELLETWKNGNLSYLKREQVSSMDISHVHEIRKSLLIKFLKENTKDLDSFYNIYQDIELLYRDINRLTLESFVEVQQELNQKEKFLTETVLESTFHGIVALEAIRNDSKKIIDFKYVVINDQAQKMLGKNKEHIIGKLLLTEYSATLAEGIFDKYVEVVETGRSTELIFKYKHEGFDSWFKQSINKWENGLVIMTADISQDKQKEKELQVAYDNVSDTKKKLENSFYDLEEKVRERTHELEAVNNLNALIAEEKDLEKVVQAVTDTSTKLTGAEFGAFFYTMVNEKGENLTLYTISGVPRENFSKFPMPRNTEVFAPTFVGKGIVRSDDITKDKRYGKNAPHKGMPEGHLPVKSYLAVPVMSRSGEVLGGLFFGHSKPAIFTEKSEKIISSLATQAAIAIDNLKLFEKLKSNEVIFSSVTNASPNTLWMCDEKGNINFVNKTWIDWTGKPFEKHLGAGWLEALIPEDRKKASERFLNNFHNREYYESEFRIKRTDGQLRWIIATGNARYDDNGQFLGYVGSCMDITEKKHSGDTLRQNENQLKLVTNNIPAYISYIDKNERYVFHNEHYKNLLNYKDTIKGKSISEILGDGYIRSKPNIEKVLKGEPVTFETSLKVKSGDVIEFEVRYVPDKDENGNVRGFVVMGVDLTERLQYQRELSIKNKELLKINSDLDNFIYTASHDLKAPVSNIEGLIHTLTDTLKEKIKPDSEVENIINLIIASIVRFQTTIKDLTEIGKIQRNLNEDVAEIDVRETIEDIKVSIQNVIQESKANIQLDINAPKAYFSRANFKSILYNLISNAIKYRSPERSPIVEITTSTNDDYFILEVKDNGLGLTEEQSNKVFGMFKRMHTHVEGSGIGLYIVKRIVENAGGKIEIRSKENKGTNFVIYLP